MKAQPVGVRVSAAVFTRTPIEVVAGTEDHPPRIFVGITGGMLELGFAGPNEAERLADACRELAAEHQSAALRLVDDLLTEDTP